MKITLNPSGGLANRMRSLASGLALARDMGADCDAVWGVNSELAAPFASIFDAPQEVADRIRDIDAAQYRLRYDYPRKRNLYASSLFLRRFDLRCCDADGSTFRLAGHPADLRALLQGQRSVYIQSGLEYYPVDAAEYRRIFCPSAEIAGLTDHFTARFTLQTVGIHIRRTDNNQSIRHSPDALFIEEMERLLEADPGTNFFVATDSEEVKHTLRSRFSDRILTNDHPARRDTRQGILNAAAEMYALSRCREIVGSYWSSFSEAAALLGSIPLRQLFRQ